MLWLWVHLNPDDQKAWYLVRKTLGVGGCPLVIYREVIQARFGCFLGHVLSDQEKAKICANGPTSSTWEFYPIVDDFIVASGGMPPGISHHSLALMMRQEEALGTSLN